VARNRSIAVGAYGSCCRQYAGQEGFWFEKNLTKLHQQWPEAFPDKFVRERCLDHLRQPTNQREVALEYCQRRKNEISRLVEGLKAGPTSLLPDDAIALGEAIASGVALTIQRRMALPEIPTERLRKLKQWQEAQEKAPVDLLLENPDEDWGDLLDLALDPNLEAVDGAFDTALSKSGQQLDDTSKANAKAAFTAAIKRWSKEADKAKARGALKAPKPETPAAVVSIDALCELSQRHQWHGASTIPGVRNALNKLMKWAEDEYGVKLLAAVSAEHLLGYSAFIYEHQPKSARKDLGYVKSAFDCGIQYELLPKPNPCEGIIRPKRELRQRTAKTLENKKYMSLQELHRLDEAMANDRQADIYWLQRFTGARQQEIAGLRKCDFVLKNGFRCIAIEPHEGRGMGANGQASGLKTSNSRRFIPLPAVLNALWERNHSEEAEPCFERTDNERAWGENYRGRQTAAAKRLKVPTGTHALRHTLHQVLIDDGFTPDVVMMITGKRLSISDYLRPNLEKMKEAIDRYAMLMPRNDHALTRKEIGADETGVCLSVREKIKDKYPKAFTTKHLHKKVRPERRTGGQTKARA